VIEPGRAGTRGTGPQPVFYSVARTAQLIGMSVMTLYRAIHGGEFPAVRVRGRLLVPARAIDEMVSAAMTSGSLVDASAWARPAATEPSPTAYGLAHETREPMTAADGPGSSGWRR
jgi:excisionase family DNA binding protein